MPDFSAAKKKAGGKQSKFLVTATASLVSRGHVRDRKVYFKVMGYDATHASVYISTYFPVTVIGVRLFKSSDSSLKFGL